MASLLYTNIITPEMRCLHVGSEKRFLRWGVVQLESFYMEMIMCDVKLDFSREEGLRRSCVCQSTGGLDSDGIGGLHEGNA
jgi:hypothetical protein